MFYIAICIEFILIGNSSTPYHWSGGNMLIYVSLYPFLYHHRAYPVPHIDCQQSTIKQISPAHAYNRSSNWCGKSLPLSPNRPINQCCVCAWVCVSCSLFYDGVTVHFTDNTEKRMNSHFANNIQRVYISLASHKSGPNFMAEVRRCLTVLLIWPNQNERMPSHICAECEFAPCLRYIKWTFGKRHLERLYYMLLYCYSVFVQFHIFPIHYWSAGFFVSFTKSI